MTTGQSRLNLQHQPSSIRSSPTTHSLKDDHCPECQKLLSAADPGTGPGTCIHNCKFAPTPNQFGALAELEMSSTPPKSAFDFVPPPSSHRRRGKRGGRHNRLRSEARKRREALKSDDMGDLSGKAPALRLDEPTKPCAVAVTPKPQSQYSLPWTDFTFFTETMNWAPQFRPNSESSLLKAPAPPKRCLTKSIASRSHGEAVGFGRQESHYFPMSAFLAGPSTTNSPTEFKNTNLVRATQTRPTIQVSKKALTSAQKDAALAICRALATRVSHAASSITPPVSHARPPLSPPSSVPTSRPVIRPTASRMPPMVASSSDPLPITPPQTLSPTLSTSPVTTNAPSMDWKPNVVPDTPFLQPTQVTSTPHQPVPSLQNTLQPCAISDSSAATCALSLITAPITSPFPFISPSRPYSAPLDLSVRTNPRGAISSIPDLPKCDAIAPLSSSVQDDLKPSQQTDHATNCWCCKPPSTDNCLSSLNTWVPPRWRDKPASDQTMVEDRDMETEMETLVLSPPSSEHSHFLFEDLGSTGFDLLTPSGSEGEDRTASDTEEEDWTLVPSGEEPSLKKPSPAPLRTTLASLLRRDAASPPTAAVSYRTAPRTPASTPRTPSVSPPRGSGYKKRSWTSDMWSSPYYMPWQATCADCAQRKCVCAKGRTSGVDWPALRDSFNVKRTRRKGSESASGEGVDEAEGVGEGVGEVNIWDEFVSWFD